MKKSTCLIWLGLLLICNSTFAQLCTAKFSSVVNGFNVLVTNESETIIEHPNYIITSNGITEYRDESFDTISFHYDQPGTYTITLEMYSADTLQPDCASTFIDTIFIEEPVICKAKFSCVVEGFNILITNESQTSIEHPNYSITTNNQTAYRDELFDTISFHYDQPGSYVITLLMYNADSSGFECTSIYKDTIVIFEPSICEAKIIDKYPSFLDNSEGTTAATAYLWDFGDGSTSNSQNTSHAYAVAGTYTVSLVISDSTTGCRDTAFHEKYFYPIACKGALYYQQDSDVVYFSPKFIPLVFTPTSIAWDYGDGTTGTQSFHHYDSTGAYFVCCVAIDSNLHCTTSNICKWVTVICNEGCAPEFAYTQDCGLVTFENGIIYTPTTTSYLWDFGDGKTAKGINVKHKYQVETGVVSTYNACLQLLDPSGCNKSICHAVEVSCEITGITIHSKSDPELSNLQLYPVPFSDELHVSYTINRNTPLTITIYDCLGQKIMDESIQTQAVGENNIILNGSELSKGIYILKMATRNGQLTKQLIKQ